MNRRSLAQMAVWALLLLFLGGLAACSTMQVPDKVPAWTPRKVVVLPFRKVAPNPGDGMARSPLTGAAFFAGKGVKGSEGLSTLDRSLANILAQIAPFKVIPTSRAYHIYNQLRRSMEGQSLRRIVSEVGRKLGADGVLVGHLYRFDRRQGSEYSVKSPASVAFDLAMVRVNDGMVVWKNSFDERQRALSEDLFNLEQYMTHGLRWYTAEEMCRIGMQQLMQRFPWRKTPPPQQQ